MSSLYASRTLIRTNNACYQNKRNAYSLTAQKIHLHTSSADTMAGCCTKNVCCHKMMAGSLNMKTVDWSKMAPSTMMAGCLNMKTVDWSKMAPSTMMAGCLNRKTVGLSKMALSTMNTGLNY
jgi:hypothetical protein